MNIYFAPLLNGVNEQSLPAGTVPLRAGLDVIGVGSDYLLSGANAASTLMSTVLAILSATNLGMLML